MANPQLYFKNQHVIVTGGSSGIGLACAHQLAGYGAELTLVARRSQLLEEAKAELHKLHPDVTIHLMPLDISDEAQVMERVGAHIEAHPANMLINNAGVATPGRFLEQESHHHRQHMDINYFGAVNMCRAVLPQLVERGGGHVVNVGSLLSVMGIYGYSSYAASKFALYGFSECLRAELWPHKVHVSVLLPPDTDTPQHAAEMALLPEETKAIAGNVKMLSAEQVADVMLKGMAAKKFELIPGLESRFTVTANRWIPGVVRQFCDHAQKKTQRSQVS